MHQGITQTQQSIMPASLPVLLQCCSMQLTMAAMFLHYLMLYTLMQEDDELCNALGSLDIQSASKSKEPLRGLPVPQVSSQVVLQHCWLDVRMSTCSEADSSVICYRVCTSDLTMMARQCLALVLGRQGCVVCQLHAVLTFALIDRL